MIRSAALSGRGGTGGARLDMRSAAIVVAAGCGLVALCAAIAHASVSTIVLVAAGACAVSVLAAGVANPNLAVLLVVAALPFDGYGVRTPFVALTPSNAAIAVACAALIGRAMQRGGALTPIAAVRPYLVLTGWLMLAEVASALIAGGASSDALTVRPIITWAGFAAVIWLIGVESKHDAKLERRIVAALAISMALLAIATLLVLVGVLPESQTGNFGKVRSVAGVQLPFGRALGSPVAFGFFGMLAALVLPMLLQSRRRAAMLPLSRMSSGVLVAGILAMAFVTVSRGVWLTVTIVMAAHLVLGRLRPAWRTGALPLGVTLMAVLVLVPASPLHRYSAGFASGLVEIDHDTVEQRIELSAVAVDLFSDHPLFGAGTAQAEHVTQERVAADAVIHNKFLGMLASVGLFGFVPFCLLWIFASAGAWRLYLARDALAKARGGAYLAATVGMVVQLQFFPGDSLKVAAVLFALIACTEAARDRMRGAHASR